MALTVATLAEHVGAEVRGDAARTVLGAAPLDLAGPTDLAFAADAAHWARLSDTRAAAVIVPRAADLPVTQATLILADDARLAFAQALAILSKHEGKGGGTGEAGIDPRAAVAASASVDPSARVHALASIGEHARIGARCVVFGGAHVGEGAEIGDDTLLHPNAVVYARSKVGARCVVHAGAVIGSDGYGFVSDGGAWKKVPQVGVAVIEDDVEIGAGCTIDRGALGETRIGAGTKLDNLVHVGHNVRIGKNCLLVAQVGIAGSTTIGDDVVLGGQVGVGGHLTIASGVRVGGQGGVAKNLSAAGDYWGTPARPHGSWLKMLAGMTRLPRLEERLRALALKVELLERTK